MEKQEEATTTKTLMVALALALFLLVWGLMIFYMVGNKEMSNWFYGTQADVPGQSIYSTQRSRIFPGTGPLPYRESIRPQHVDGRLTAPPNPLEEDNGDGPR